MTLEFFPQEFFERFNNEEDALSYLEPHRTSYVDDEAILALVGVLQDILPLHGAYLDLMSGWNTPLPKKIYPKQVIGLGLNALEMAENDQLDEHIIHDLNENPHLPFDNRQFEVVVCYFSVQYLIRPVEVFREVNRVLKPDGLFIVAFSDPYFPHKAIAIWRVFNDQQRKALVKRYFETSGDWREIESWDKLEQKTSDSDSLYVVWGKKAM